MKKLTLLTLVMLLFSITYGQTSFKIYVGPSLPGLDFGKRNLTDYYSTEIGGAGTGIATGASFLLHLKKGLHLSIGADLLYNGLKPVIKKDLKEKYKKYDINAFRQYYHIPVTAGLNYTIPSLRNNTFFITVSAGIDFLKVRGVSGYGFYHNAIETINNSESFLIKIEYGIILKKNYTIGLTFFNLGKHSIQGYWEDTLTGTPPTDNFQGDIKMGAISFNLGLKF